MMSLVVVIGLVAACTASPSLYFSGPQYYSGYYPSAVVSPIKSQYHAQNEQGQYAYGYNDGYSSKSETKHANGLTEGAYSYVDPNGVLQQYKYVSDENGYRVSGTNLPAAPVPVTAYAAAPVAVAFNGAEAPQPVQDTPEVVAAKVAHQAAYEQAKKAADEAPAAEAELAAPVQDTPEVAAAKAAHQAAHDQAKQAAVAYTAYPSYAVAAPTPVASYAYAAAPAPAYAHVAPVAPVAPVAAVAEAPQPVQDTPEVAAAKEAHQAAFEQAKKAAEEAPADEGQSEPASDAVEVTAAGAVTKTAAPAVAYSYQAAYPSYAVAAPAPVASYAYAAPAYKYAAAAAVAAPVPVASYGYAAAAPAYAYAPFAAGSYSPVHSQYHSQDEFGQYSYGYNSGSSSKAEVKTLDGVTRGGYSYVDSNGVVQHYNYVSDPINGFRVAGTNLPSNSL